MPAICTLLVPTESNNNSDINIINKNCNTTASAATTTTKTVDAILVPGPTF
jgi:hypothetical protein